MKQYIQSNNQIKKNIQVRIGNFNVVVIDEIDSQLLIDAIGTISKQLPEKYSSLIDIIYVGQFQKLQSRNLNALYSDGAIYTTNNQENISDLVEDIIHETAHAVEEVHGLILYGDGQMEKEFLQKRQSLQIMLNSEGFDTSSHDLNKSSYNEALDNFLYQEVGYSYLSVLTANLFFSPYASTSLREYWGNGFEAFYAHRKPEILKKISPMLYNKIISLGENT